MVDVEHLRSQKKQRQDRSGNCQHLAESEAADRLRWPGQQIKNVQRGKTANQRDQDVVQVVRTFGENQRLQVYKRHRR